MRRQFSATMEEISNNNDKIVFLTGDLGFMALENVREALGERFVNAGVSEQNMISMAASLASDGFTPICYSIAPFTVFRPAEQIRLDVCLHNKNVKIVGNGGGYGYGIMGSTHHAIEDIGVLSTFQNMTCYIPFCREDVDTTIKNMLKKVGPGYLRLGSGELPEGIKLPAYAPIRKVISGDEITVIALGPIALNALDALKQSQISGDLFVISEVPILKLSKEIIESIQKTKKVIIVEEHVQRGGIAENISLLILQNGLSPKVMNFCALGYPNGKYGSQKYHQELCKLDAKSITKSLKELINES
ncbi:MAG: transketolase C-terminal domain-containing protein [Candidatus Saccharibacteria bacterium]